jgi:hypothetical protein
MRTASALKYLMLYDVLVLVLVAVGDRAVRFVVAVLRLHGDDCLYLFLADRIHWLRCVPHLRASYLQCNQGRLSVLLYSKGVSPVNCSAHTHSSCVPFVPPTVFMIILVVVSSLDFIAPARIALRASHYCVNLSFPLVYVISTMRTS